MNRSIRATAMFSLILSIVLLGNLSYVQGFTQEKYAENPHNRRQYYAMKSVPRGQIAAGGVVLAQSNPDENGFYQRSYPAQPLIYGPVLGYFSDIYGTAGVERGFNSYLDGSASALLGGHFLDSFVGKATPGANLELTLNPAVQQVAFNELASRGYEGAVVALQPSTGAILAMASTPSFDPAPLANNDTAESAWQELTNNPGDPLLNHASQETLPPGSTFKVITTAAGLNNGFTLNSPLTAANEITLPGTTATLENYAGTHCGEGEQTTLLEAFTLSCNTAFAEMGMEVGADELRKYAQAFGADDTYDLGIPVQAGVIGDLADSPAVGQSSIGQRDVAMSVLANAVVAATVANKGVRMEPYLLAKVTGPDLSVIEEHKPKELNEAVTPEVAAQLTELMRSSERHTLGYAGQDIASKTGTAEHGVDSRDSNPHAWYIAFSPSSDVAVAVVVKNGGDRGQAATGGSVAAPIGRAVIAAASQNAAQNAAGK